MSDELRVSMRLVRDTGEAQLVGRADSPPLVRRAAAGAIVVLVELVLVTVGVTFVALGYVGPILTDIGSSLLERSRWVGGFEP